MSAGATALRRGDGLWSLDWYVSMSGNPVHSFCASPGGWSLDAFDYMVFTFALTAIGAAFRLNPGPEGLVATVTLVVSGWGACSPAASARCARRPVALLFLPATHGKNLSEVE